MPNGYLKIMDQVVYHLDSYVEDPNVNPMQHNQHKSLLEAEADAFWDNNVHHLQIICNLLWWYCSSALENYFY